MSETLKDGLKHWEEGPLKKALDKHPERLKSFTSLSSEPIDRLYTPLNIPNLKPDQDLGFPGEFPYTRGVYPTMYRGRFWTMRQFAGFGTAEDTNERFHYLLKNGQMGLSTAFDFPTLMGYDSDHKRSLGEVGVCGVAIDTLRDMEVLFKGIPLDKVTTSMTINPPAPILFSMYLEVAAQQGVPLDKVGGTIQNDMLKEFIAQKTWMYPPEPSVRLTMDLIEYATQHVPKWHPVSISGYHIREAGSTAVQELAFTLRDGLEYVQLGVDRGLDVDGFAPKLSHFFNAHNDFFEELAKYRAARRIWAKEMKRRFHPKNPESMRLKFHTQTAGCSLTAQQPMNNVVRTAIQALAGVLGGTQSLHTNSLDETYALPTEETVRIALRTQQIIAHESGLTDTIDPFGGSYYLETLTDDMEKKAMAYITKIDDLGGMMKAIELGYPQKEITDAAYRYQQQVEKKEKSIIGINDCMVEEEEPLELLRIGPEVEARQVKALNATKNKRDNEAVQKSLGALKEAAAGTENLIPLIRQAVREYATIGEIMETMKQVFGGYQDPGYF
jgi:methylmalonyl-CoA mutase, N-terminal domain